MIVNTRLRGTGTRGWPGGREPNSANGPGRPLAPRLWAVITVLPCRVANTEQESQPDGCSVRQSPESIWLFVRSTVQAVRPPVSKPGLSSTVPAAGHGVEAASTLEVVTSSRTNTSVPVNRQWTMRGRDFMPQSVPSAKRKARCRTELPTRRGDQNHSPIADRDLTALRGGGRPGARLSGQAGVSRLSAA